MLADMAIQIEAVSALYIRHAGTLAVEQNISKEAAMAKVLLDTAMRVTTDAVQIWAAMDI